MREIFFVQTSQLATTMLRGRTLASAKIASIRPKSSLGKQTTLSPTKVECHNHSINDVRDSLKIWSINDTPMLASTIAVFCTSSYVEFIKWLIYEPIAGFLLTHHLTKNFAAKISQAIEVHRWMRLSWRPFFIRRCRNESLANNSCDDGTKCPHCLNVRRTQ